jgi:predicted GNAT family acetyltransferase
MDTTVGPPDDACRDQQILHVPERDRFEARQGGTTLAVLQYADSPAGTDGSAPVVRDLLSTVVAPDAGGHGIGSRLVRFVLDDARRHHLRVRATCWFARGWIERHEDYQDLLAPADTERADAKNGPTNGEDAQ